MQFKYLISVVVAAVFVSMSGPSQAQTPACDALDKNQRAQAHALLSSLHPHDCCDDNLLACVKAKPTCRLAWRLTFRV